MKSTFIAFLPSFLDFPQIPRFSMPLCLRALFFSICFARISPRALFLPSCLTVLSVPLCPSVLYSAVQCPSVLSGRLWCSYFYSFFHLPFLVNCTVLRHPAFGVPAVLFTVLYCALFSYFYSQCTVYPSAPGSHCAIEGMT